MGLVLYGVLKLIRGFFLVERELQSRAKVKSLNKTKNHISKDLLLNRFCRRV